VGFLKQMKRETEEEEAAYQALVTELLRNYPKHLPLLSARLSCLTGLPAEKQKMHLQASSLRLQLMPCQGDTPTKASHWLLHFHGHARKWYCIASEIGNFLRDKIIFAPTLVFSLVWIAS
jgi:hypothetical protein